MTRFSSILVTAVSLALGACASDNMTMDTHGNNNDPNRFNTATGSNISGDRTLVYSSDGRPTQVSQQNIDAIHQALPDNPQLGGGNDKNVAILMSEADRQFMVAAIRGGDFEANASLKALLKSNNEGVKSFAQYMLDDHAKVNQQAQNLASRRGLTAPLGQTTDQVEKLATLDKLNGADFDAEYLRQQRQAHDEAITLFTAAASSANDKFIRDWAAATLPGLHNHHDMLDALQGRANDIGMAK